MLERIDTADDTYTPIFIKRVVILFPQYADYHPSPEIEKMSLELHICN